MAQNSPVFRFALYASAVAGQVLAFFARDLHVGWATAMQDTANFLGALAGVTAIGNLSKPKDPTP